MTSEQSGVIFFACPLGVSVRHSNNMTQERLTKVVFDKDDIRGDIHSLNVKFVTKGVGDDKYEDSVIIANLPDPPLTNSVHKYIVENIDEANKFSAIVKITNTSTRRDTDYIGQIKKIIFDTRVPVPDKTIFARMRKYCKGNSIDCFERSGKFFFDNSKYRLYYAAMTAFELTVIYPFLLRKGEKLADH